MRALLAATAGSAIAAATVTLALIIYNIFAYQGQSLDYLSAMTWFLALTFLTNSTVACTLGMFWHSVAQKCGWTSVHYYWPVALMAGVFPALVLMLPQYPAGDLDGGVAITVWLQGLVTTTTLGAALGGLTGIFAWLIRRPDRDAPNPTTPAP